MQVNIDPGQAEEPERAGMSRRHREVEGRKEAQKDTKNERARAFVRSQVAYSGFLSTSRMPQAKESALPA